MIAADRTLLEQARELQALAQTGLAYCKDPSTGSVTSASAR